MRPIALGGVGLEEERGALVAVLLLNAAPDAKWIAFFCDNARRAVFDVGPANVRRNQVRIGLPRREDLGELIQWVERWIEAANAAWRATSR